ncbi:MAG: tyrosine-type recombinase/integrase, partial [Ilumatobacteraceae bacterium]
MSSLADQLVREARRGGVSEADLRDAFNRLNDPTHGRTVAEHAAIAMEAMSAGTRGTYKTYVLRFVGMFGERRVVDITFRDLEVFAAEMMKNRTKRCNTNDDRLPENCVGALRNMFTLAVKHGIRSDNPAMDLKKPSRSPKYPRSALERHELVELVNVTRRDSNDPDLDVLIMRFMLETGCRREGVLNLTVNDIDVNRNKVRLDEKTARFV